MGRSKKANTTSGIVALGILCVTSLVLFTVYVREGDSGPLHTIQLGASEVLRPARGLFGFAASPFLATGERIEGVLNGSANEVFEARTREYEEGAARAALLSEENQRLRRLLEGEQVSFEYAPLARVVAPVGGQLAERVVINVGTNDGVRPEQPVVVGDSTLVGRTTEQVTPNTAEVLLVTDRSFAAGVRVFPPGTSPEDVSEEESHGEGLLRNNWEGYLGVDYVELNAEAEQGDFVLTSGRAGDRELLFPPGLLVGTVESVNSRDIDQYKNIVVAPALKADDLQEVRVIVDW